MPQLLPDIDLRVQSGIVRACRGVIALAIGLSSSACHAPARSTVAASESARPAGQSHQPSAAATALADVLTWLNGEPLDEAAYVQRFTPAFVAEVPHATFVELLGSLKSDPAWMADETERSAKLELVAIIRSADQALRVSLSLSGAPDAPPRIAGLLLEPAERRAFEAPADIDEAIARLEAQGALSLLVASTTSTACEPLVARNAAAVVPVASAFKLWVLAAIVKEVRAGTIRWEQQVTIQDALDSLPSGTTQDEPDGSTLAVRELAARMISVSDNTATDHLIHLVGRGAVEQVLLDLGHRQPERTRPFLTTREAFILKLGGVEALRDAYLAADEGGRRLLLQREVAAAALPTLGTANALLAEGPRDIERLEWFGSPHDLCRVLVQLSGDRTAREILARNPGVPDGSGQWAYVGFKGGSEPGVVASAWAHETVDGARFVTAGVMVNPDQALDTLETVQLLASIRDLSPSLARR